MPNAAIPADLSERKKAIRAPGHAFVWASAGTGKTHTLTLRALYSLLHAPFLTPESGRFSEIRGLYDPTDRPRRLRAARATVRSLVLTTFTRKAAAEMQTRLYAYLDLLASTPDFERLVKAAGQDTLFLDVCCDAVMSLGGDLEPPAQAYARLRMGAEALAEMACEFQIATIHSLAASLLQRHPIESGVPSGARFAEENDDVGDLDEPLVRRWWLSEGLVAPELAADIQKSLERILPYQIRDWFKTAYHHPELLQEIEALKPPDSNKLELLYEACSALSAKLLGRNGRRITANAAKLGDLAARCRAGDKAAWEQACAFFYETRGALFLDSNGTPQTVKAAIHELPPEQAAFFETSAGLQSLCARMFTLVTCADQWTSWKRVLARFVAWSHANSVSATGIVGFDEMIRLAADLLERHPGVRASERRRLRALLVDEFQDTDPEQLRLISALLRRERDDDHEVIGFFVGDTKQSIYRFRGADVDSTVRFHDLYVKLTGCALSVQDLTLSTSFRSIPPITSLVNGLFSQYFGLTKRTQEELSPNRSEQAELPEWVWIDQDADGQPLTAATSRRAAAVETARIIQDLRTRRQARWNEILVLVRSGRELDAALAALEDAGIPVVSSGARTLYRQPEVSDVLNLLIALHDPLDTLAVGAVLRSPLAALSDAEIHRLVGEVKPSRLIQSADPLPDFLPEVTRERLTALRRLAATRGSSSGADWLLELRRLLPLVAYTDPLDLEGRSHVRINRLFEAFQAEIQAACDPPLTWLLKQRARAAGIGRYDVDLGEDVSVADDSIDAVRVMTIHKAKGLEARYTLVYCWSSVLHEVQSPIVNRRSPLFLSARDGTDTRFAFSLPFGPITLGSDNLADALAQEEESCKAEAVRLAYVACTRARDGLTLISATSQNCAYPDTFDELRKQASSLGTTSAQASALDGLVTLRLGSGDEAPSQGAPAPTLTFDAEQYCEIWRQKRKRADEQERLPFGHPSAVAEEDAAPVEGNGAGASGDVLKMAGTLVHAYLERWLLDPQFEPDKLARLAAGFNDSVPEALARAEGSLRLFYEGALPGGPLFSYHARARNCRVLGRETPFYMSYDGTYWNGVIDLVLEERGVILGVDYKTAAEKEQLPDSYARQARVYTEALKRIFPGRRVEFEFWWLAPPAGQGRKARRK